MNSFTLIASTPDNSARAEQLIELGLAMDPEARDETLARLIAAAIHEGADSALCRFAGTGELQRDAALSELSAVVVPFEQEWWVDALGRHVLYSTRHHP